MKPSERYLLDSNLMMDFRNSFVALINNARPVPKSITMVELRPADGVTQETWSQLYSETARAAGAAAAAYPRYGGTFTLRNPAVIMSDVDPVANWQMSIEDPQQLDPMRVIASVESAVAQARQKSAEAKDAERGVTGVVASFLRWPANLREAVGPGRSAQRTAATVIGVVGQIVVGAATAALATGLVAGIVALWQLIF